MKDKKIQLLAALVILTIAVGLVWLKYYSPSKLDSQASHASEEQAHWPHDGTPFKLPLINHSSAVWSSHLAKVTQIWEQEEVMDYDIISKPQPTNQCYPISLQVEGMNFCSFSEDNSWLALALYVQGPGDPHILGARVMVNDFYLNNPKSEYSTDAWRNNQVCQWLGWTAGIPLRVEEDPTIKSCMNVYTDFKNVDIRQNPDSDDYDALKILYSHIDDTSSSAISYKIAKANEFLKKQQFGVLTQTLDKGQKEFYSQDLGDGYKMITAIDKIPKVAGSK